MTTKGALLPCVNRNLPHIIDHNGYGLIAYGSRGCIYTLYLSTEFPSIIDSKLIRNAHRGKIFSLSFCKSNNNQLLASIGEEMELRIWDLESGTRIATLEVKDFSRIVEWLHDTTNSVVFPDLNGYVSKWNFSSNNVVRIRSGSDREITALSSNPNRPELLAVGHSVGTISILNVNTHTYMKCLKAHSMELYSLSWSPVSPFLLLSSSLDQSTRLWNIDEDKPVHTYYYPSSRYKDKYDDKKNSRVCSIFHPDKTDVIICSNVRGAFGSVQFSENVPPKFTPYSTEDADPNFRNTFKMLPYIDITHTKKHILVSCDVLRINLWNISDQKLLSSCNFILGNIFDLTVSPINHNLLAVGVGDGFLKVLNMQTEKKSYVTSVFINLRMKIMTTAWHPVDESIIAYGSDEGRVGIVDIYKKRSMYSFETHHTSSVYCLQWGPCSKIRDDKQTYFLYSCGGGTILIHELGKSKEKAIEFETILNIPDGVEKESKTYSELRWKSDYTCLALGTFIGSVYLFNDKFDFLCRLCLHVKNVEDLRWHPLHTYSSYSKESQYSSWLAVAGNDENINVFDTCEIISKPPEAGICKPTKTLVGHKKRVSTLCWSSHTDGYLVSGARDGAIQVWNVIAAVPVVNYLLHKDRVHSVLWSPLDPDVIYSGGMDNCLRIWRISEQSLNEIPSKALVSKHKPFKGKHKPFPNEKIPPEALNHSPKKLETSISETKEVFEDHFTSESEKEQTPKIENEKQLKAKIDIPKEPKGNFVDCNTYSKEESFQNVFKLVDFLCDESASNDEVITNKMTSEELLNLGLFVDQFTALKMLETKGKMEMASGNTSKAACLQVMACNVIELLAEAAEKKKLTDFLVAMSPSVSHQCWLNMCEKYAVQLIEEQQFMKGSIYFMLCGKLHDALRILMERGRFLDALALAKSRLPESDPVIKSILFKVCYMYSNRNQRENEAACYIALKDPRHAAKVMFCAGDSKYAFASMYICKKFNLTEAAHEYAVLCVEKCLCQNDLSTFYKVAEMDESVKIYKVLFRVHEILSTHIKLLKKVDGVVGNNIFGVTGSKILIWSGKMLENSNAFLISHLYDVLKSEGLLPEDKKILQDIHQALTFMEARNSEVPAEAHVTVAIYISQVILTTLLGDLDSATKYFTKIFPCTYNVVFMPKIISWISFPLDVYWCSNKNTFLCEVKQMNMDILPSSTHFQDIFNSVCDRFGSAGDSDADVLNLAPLKASNFDQAIQQALTFLSSKTTEDSFLLYFATQYLNELRRLAKRGWKYRCYENGQVSNIVEPEVVRYVYSSEMKQWLISSDETSDVEKSISKADVLKLDFQDNFKLNVREKENLDVPSITEVISLIFSSETDSGTKDKLVQHYGCKNVSKFLQKLMSCNKVSKQENEPSDLIENVEDQKDECGESLLDPEDEDLHAQCWTDISLYYVVTKSLFSIIFRDEYALLYCLQKYLHSLDKQIANLVRLTSTSISSQKSEIKDVKESERNLNISDNSVSSLSPEIVSLSVPEKHNVIHEDQVESNKLEDCKALIDHLENNPAELTDVNILDNNANFGKEKGCEITDVIALNDNVDKIRSPNIPLLDSEIDAVNLDTDEEESMCKHKISVLNDEDGDLKEDNSTVNIHITVPSKETKISNSVCSEKTKDDNNSKQEQLQTEREKISDQIKLLQLKEFWYPDPFLSIVDIKGICCDIFRKHPCALIKEKFHKFAHEIDQWNTKFCLTDTSAFCEICKKSVPNL